MARDPLRRRRNYLLARGIRVPGVLSAEQTLRELTRIAVSDGRPIRRRLEELQAQLDAGQITHEEYADQVLTARMPVEKGAVRVNALKTLALAHGLLQAPTTPDLDREIERELARITGRVEVVDLPAGDVMALPAGEKKDTEVV